MLRPGTSCGGFKESLKPWIPLGPYSILCTQQCCIHVLWYTVGALLPYQRLSLLHVSTPSLGQEKTQKSSQQRLLYLFRNHSTDTCFLLVCLLAFCTNCIGCCFLSPEFSMKNLPKEMMNLDSKNKKGVSLCHSGLP